MKWTEAVPSQAILHQLKEVEVFTAWPEHLDDACKFCIRNDFIVSEP